MCEYCVPNVDSVLDLFEEEGVAVGDVREAVEEVELTYTSHTATALHSLTEPLHKTQLTSNQFYPYQGQI